MKHALLYSKKYASEFALDHFRPGVGNGDYFHRFGGIKLGDPQARQRMLRPTTTKRGLEMRVSATVLATRCYRLDLHQMLLINTMYYKYYGTSFVRSRVCTCRLKSLEIIIQMLDHLVQRIQKLYKPSTSYKCILY